MCDLVRPQAFHVQVYSTDSYTGFKTPAMHELDRTFGDIRSRIIDKESSFACSFVTQHILICLLLFRLQELITSRRFVILQALEVAAILDCLISLAIAAELGNWVRPRFQENSTITILDGRHALLEGSLGGNFVSNDVR